MEPSYFEQSSYDKITEGHLQQEDLLEDKKGTNTIAAVETWTLKKDDGRWIDAFEIRFWQIILKAPKKTQHMNISVVKELEEQI